MALVSLSIAYAPLLSPYSLSILTLISGVLWMRKGRELGTESVRGRFYTVMGTGLLVQSLGFLLTEVGEEITLSLPAAALYLITRLLFLVGNLYYVLYFRSLGYGIGPLRTSFVLLFTLGVGGVVLFFGGTSGVPLMGLLVATDILMLFIILYNLLLLQGSETAHKWAVGSAVILSMIAADLLLASGTEVTHTVSLWAVSFILMGAIAVMKG